MQQTQKKETKTEHVNITLPVGLASKAKELGINLSFHATKAIQKEVIRVEGCK